MAELDKHLEKVDGLLYFGKKLLHIMAKQGLLQKRNLIVYAFLRKGVRTYDALRCLLLGGFEEETQILARSLIETRINLDYFLMIARDDLEKATMRVLDSIMLEKIKALNATEYRIGECSVDRGKWNEYENEIKSRYADREFRQIKKNGFSGISLEARATKSKNKRLYDLAYRLYSRNVHSTDIVEQLGPVTIPEMFPNYKDSRVSALLEAANLSLSAVIDACNDWLGKPM